MKSLLEEIADSFYNLRPLDFHALHQRFCSHPEDKIYFDYKDSSYTCTSCGKNMGEPADEKMPSDYPDEYDKAKDNEILGY